MEQVVGKPKLGQTKKEHHQLEQEARSYSVQSSTKSAEHQGWEMKQLLGWTRHTLLGSGVMEALKGFSIYMKDCLKLTTAGGISGLVQ